jgi:hypothetical protein
LSVSKAAAKYGVHDYFEARATVIYGNPNLGLGLVFREGKPPCVEVLRKWLLQAMRDRDGTVICD